MAQTDENSGTSGPFRVWMNQSEHNSSFVDYIWRAKEQRAIVPPRCGLRLPPDTERVVGSGSDMQPVAVKSGQQP